MEIEFLAAALILGLTSSFHCVGMCGPIALSMGLTKKQATNFYLQNLTYQFGRIVTYALLGAVLGIVGQGFQLAGLQQYLTIGVGVLLIVMALFSFGGKDFASKLPFLSQSLLKVKMALGRLLQKADYKSRFATGILNGFLPCGMVYMALTASLAAGGVWQSAAYMAVFGLGTLPLMFLVVVLGQVMTQSLRLTILKIVPFVMIILGALFILRGLELGIPYVSPKKEAMQIHQPNDINSQNQEHCH